MTRPVSIVVPSLDDTGLFEEHFPALLQELEKRALADEVVVVDDTGRDVLGPWFAKNMAGPRVVASPENSGFAPAAKRGVEAARHELVFLMNPDVRVHPDFLDPLVACLEDPKVGAVVPRVLLDGDPERVESAATLSVENGEVVARSGSAESDLRAEALLGAPRPVAFPVGGATLVRRAELLARGVFDPLFEPFYWEDVDLGWSLWRAGLRVLYQPASVVEHHHRGTIGQRVPKDLVRAAIEKNRLLFQWKHLDGAELLAQHVAALYRRAIDAYMEEDRDGLVWLALALDQAEAALEGRTSGGKGFEALLDELA